MDTKEVKVCGLKTVPRYIANWPTNIINSAFNANNIPLVTSGGVFYGQCMQRMMEDAIEKGVDIVVTVDFDSVFRPDQLKLLIQTISNSDHIDALAALQSRRGAPHPLFNPDGEYELGKEVQVEFKGEPLRVSTAHFGLTAIKLDRLKDVPKPWFCSKAGDDGTWGDGRIDDDIWFWKQWASAGRSVYVDSSVSIGHMEEMVSMYDSEGQHVIRYPNDWYEENVLCRA
jgi:hypothetical protein